MYEDGGNINTIGTRHTVLAVVAGNVFQTHNPVSHVIVQISHLLFRQRLQRTIAQQVVLQVLHIRHSAEYGEHTLRGSCISESPRSHATLRSLLFQLCHEILRKLHQSSAQQRLHNDGRNVAFLQLGIEIAGVNIAAIDFVGIVPVQVVQLYLNKIPMVFFMTGHHLVEHRFLSMERETQVTDTTSFAFLLQEVHDAVVYIASVELVHTTAYSVQQVVVDIVHLQFFHRVAVHLYRLFAGPVVVVEVRQLRSHEILRALVTAQGNTRAPFRLSLTIDG